VKVRGRGCKREYPGGPQRAKHFARKVDAERFLTTVEHSKLVGSYVDPAKGKVTVAQYVETWLERMIPTWRGTTAVLVEVYLRRHVLSTLGPRPLASIRRSDIEASAAALPLAASTAGTVRQHLGQVFAAAVEDGLLVRNPAAGARMPRVEDRRTQPLARPVVDALEAAAPAWFRVAFPLGLGLGLRQGERRD
jgi:hypothetical protein